MEFLTFEDETGIVETTFFPQTYRRFCHIIDRQRVARAREWSGRLRALLGRITLRIHARRPEPPRVIAWIRPSMVSMTLPRLVRSWIVVTFDQLSLSSRRLTMP